MVKIIGTSHVSSKSVDKVRRKIEEEDPDVVGVELDQDRYEQLVEDKSEDISDEEIKSVITGGGSSKFLVQTFLQSFQGIMGKKAGMEPGSDMREAVLTAEENDIDVELIDRNINTTFERLVTKLTLFTKLKMLGLLIYSGLYMLYCKIMGKSVDFDQVDYEEMAEDPEEDDAKEAMEELKSKVPSVYEIMIDERDRYMSSEIKELENQYDEVMAVVGAGHKPGMKSYLNMDNIPDIEPLDNKFSIPTLKIIGIMIPICLIASFFFLLMSSISTSVVLTIGALWVLANGIPTFILTYLSGGTLISSLIGGSIAWFSSINPLLAPGWIVGYIELRNYQVSTDDINTVKNHARDPPYESLKKNFKSMMEIPTFRLMTIVASTNIGSVIGTLAFLLIVLPILQVDIDLAQSIIEGFYNTLNLLLSQF